MFVFSIVGPLFSTHGFPDVVILWMDEILHQFETIGNHDWLVFALEPAFQGFVFVRGAKWILPIHSISWPQTVVTFFSGSEVAA